MATAVVAWPTIALGDLCAVVKGTSPTMKTEPGPFPLVVTAEHRRTANSYQLEGPAVCVPLISSTGHGHASMHRVHYQEGRFALANLLVALLPKDPMRCDAKYLYHLLTAKKDEYFVPLMQGTANVSLKEQDIAGVKVPLPPLDEQRRIVARIEELAACIEQTRELRHEAMVQNKRLVRAQIDAALAELNQCHELATVESVSKSVTDGDHQPPPKAVEGVPFILISNITTGKLDLSNCNWVSPEYFASLSPTRLPERGDVLYAAVGATYGTPCLVDTDQPFCFQRHIAIIKPDLQRVLSKYLWWALSSETVYAQASAAVTGSAQPTVPLRGIRKLQFPLPPRSKQELVVRHLDELQRSIDRVTQLQTDTQVELDALLPSVLDKAFRGEL